MNQPTLSGLHHVTLNVHDIERSERWYSEVLGFTRVTAYATGTFQRVILRNPESGVVLGLNRHTGPVAVEPFDERRPGLDHLALQVPDRGTLDAWVSRFDELNVTHSEVKPGAIPGSFLVVFRDPDDLQLEVFATA
ncbi:MAG: VOC family protein [Micromonosporaceae bacterium]